MSLVKKFFIGLLSTCMLIALWAITARIAAIPFILPSPESVFLDCVRLFGEGSFRSMLLATCTRGLVAFFVSLTLSLFLGFACGNSPVIAAAMNPWMSVIKSTPVVAFILIALLWFGSSIVPAFVAILMTLPVMTEAIAQGVRSSDPKLLEMAQVYRFGKFDKLVHVQIPSAMPFFFAGAGSSLGLTWKVVVAGEILSAPRAGIGSAMQTAKVHLETSRVFSLTIMAIFLSVCTELLFNAFVRLSKRRLGQEGDA